jgi:hypothetical protein
MPGQQVMIDKHTPISGYHTRRRRRQPDSADPLAMTPVEPNQPPSIEALRQQIRADVRSVAPTDAQLQAAKGRQEAARTRELLNNPDPTISGTAADAVGMNYQGAVASAGRRGQVTQITPGNEAALSGNPITGRGSIRGTGLPISYVEYLPRDAQGRVIGKTGQGHEKPPIPGPATHAHAESIFLSVHAESIFLSVPLTPQTPHPRTRHPRTRRINFPISHAHAESIFLSVSHAHAESIFLSVIFLSVNPPSPDPPPTHTQNQFSYQWAEPLVHKVEGQLQRRDSLGEDVTDHPGVRIHMRLEQRAEIRFDLCKTRTRTPASLSIHARILVFGLV